MKIYPFRLKPNLDLKQSLKDWAIDNQIECGFILTAIGSLKQAAIRFANQEKSNILYDKFEIISLNGTVACSGVHLHILISNGEGKTIGGHLDYGCIIYTTAEIVIGTTKAWRFARNLDPETSYNELEIFSCRES
ncbi:PPC domain-containing DNA-binding protein [Dapis sp. BLCC M172]|uniref:PPC domain-containing DNA-binding protein n=1 Tax=Dapis sp. BLCC M172 TaxID=2975281 RepID=UPI003CF20606